MERAAEHIDLLIVDDDAEYLATVVRRFSRRGYRVQEACNGEGGLELAARRQFHVAVIDLVMPGLSGVELLQKLKANSPDCEIVMLTGQGSIETAVEAMKRGAHDYLTKPFPLAELEIVVQRAFEQRQLRKENRQLKAVLERSKSSAEMIGRSAAMKEVFRLIERAGPTQKAILIQGESGTGKELVARALHQASTRADKPMVIINCAALPETLLESELFGHEKGSFTGAVSAKPGLFELADGGTLMIDEVGEMPGSLQAKLLRVLEDGSFRRVGSLKECRVDVRLLAATNREMAAEVKAGRFREDLYYRINVMSLELPSLRERAGDVALLADRFLGPNWRIEPAAMQALEAYAWPGNIRQLINVIDRAKILADGALVTLRDLPPELRQPTTARQELHGAGDRLDEIERTHVLDVFEREQGNKARAARALGINRRTLYRLLEKYGIG
ncbi:MAG TPA: sigma-54 dependent transcriptional regulator [Pirellulales bacterium]|jgi:DNA-binding NtrC family response regulator|nr:sigma-54 dependent transcriptional regulator [Pirellulales bacterium]